MGGVGTISTKGLAFNSGNTFSISATSSGWDQVNVAGTVNLANAALSP